MPSAPDKTHTNSLQQLIDAGADKGIVEIPAGTHVLHDSLHLRSGLHLLGHPDAVITRAPSISSRITDVLGYGLYEIAVADPEMFRVGMGVLIADDHAFGFYTTVATIIGQDGDRFLIDRQLNHDYSPTRNGVVTTLFPLLSGIEVEDVRLENLVIDGNLNETRELNGCRGGGVFLLGSQRVEMQNIEVRNFKGDAISFQQCADIAVRDCHVHHNSNCGLHPGSGSVRYVFEGNHAHHNDSHGLFYCLRTSHSRCENNRFEHNGKNGISIGERDSDHLIRKNYVAHNGAAGVHFRPANCNGGDRVRLEENVIGPNGLATNEAEIVIGDNLRDVAIGRNQIHCGTRKALDVANGCRQIFFANNTINGREQSAQDVSGAADSVALQQPLDFAPVGPAALPLDGARHLRFNELEPVAE